MVVILATAGCGSDWPMAPHRLFVAPTFAPGQDAFTDEELLRAAYSNYRAPATFYDEPLAGPSRPYYVNTISVAPLCCQPDQWIELSTDDTGEARGWVDSTAAHSSERTTLDPGPPVVTGRYFEFRTLGSGPVFGYRVHRRSYLDRDGVDFLARGVVTGKLNARPLDADAVRGVAEYLWFKDEGSLEGRKALSSFTRSEGDTLRHVIHDVTLMRGDYGMCDEVVQRRLEYRVVAASGLMLLVVHEVQRVGGRC